MYKRRQPSAETFVTVPLHYQNSEWKLKVHCSRGI